MYCKGHANYDNKEDEVSQMTDLMIVDYTEFLILKKTKL